MAPLLAQQESRYGQQADRALKRKRSVEFLANSDSKKSRFQVQPKSQLSSLARILQQYGLLEIIVSTLCHDDILALMLASKEICAAIVPRPGSLTNLLGKLRCSGQGIRIRRENHRKSTFFYAYDCTEYARCASDEPNHNIESRPCMDCKVTTCDECRIHCVYQSIIEKPCSEDEIASYSGFVLLSPYEVPILSHHHLYNNTEGSVPRWQDPSNGLCQKYHDQGFIDVPLEFDAYGPPEFVQDILDLDLGQNSFAMSTSSNVPNPSPVLKAFYSGTEQRKRWFCNACLPSSFAKPLDASQQKVCECTLRKHVLDRWLCLRCYQKEVAAFENTYLANTEKCACGKPSDSIICLWCESAVVSKAARTG